MTHSLLNILTLIFIGKPNGNATRNAFAVCFGTLTLAFVVLSQSSGNGNRSGGQLAWLNKWLFVYGQNRCEGRPSGR